MERGVHINEKKNLDIFSRSEHEGLSHNSSNKSSQLRQTETSYCFNKDFA